MIESCGKAISLGRVSPGHQVTLRRIHGGGGLSARLVSMGLLPGTTLEVCRNLRFGPVMVRVRGQRLVLGRGMAERMEVEDAQAPGATT